MRVLLIHPEDSPLSEPWFSQRWDLVIDLGKSSAFSERRWHERTRCPILRTEVFRQGIEDMQLLRDLFATGRKCLVDEEGLDWWELTSLVIVPEAELTLILQRVAEEIKRPSELWTTRFDWSSNLLATLLKVTLKTFEGQGIERLQARVRRYVTLLHRFKPSQLKEIALDKYDADFRWRSRFEARVQKRNNPFVLIPSAYQNVSRMAASYAQLLWDQPFVMVVTRQNAKQFVPPPNVHIRHLAAYAGASSPLQETTTLIENWELLRKNLRALPVFELLDHANVFDRFVGWFRNGLIARNAWRRVLEQEPVQSVFCGDDSNLYTRLPVLLAHSRKIPALDFHHGALDGRYVLKQFPCDLYLAKNEMERDYLVRVCGLPAGAIAVGSPPWTDRKQPVSESCSSEASVMFFSEPYEAAGMRAEEVYREILPPLCRIARAHRRSLIIKLHPFESRSQREKIVRQVLEANDQKIVSVMDGALTPELMAKAWFGVTVESTTVIDCLKNGVCCFLCGWLSLSSYEYGKQYARFGVGAVLRDADQIAEIPGRVLQFDARPLPQFDLAPAVNPALLKQWLTSAATEGPRSAS